MHLHRTTHQLASYQECAHRYASLRACDTTQARYIFFYSAAPRRSVFVPAAAVHRFLFFLVCKSSLIPTMKIRSHNDRGVYLIPEMILLSLGPSVDISKGDIRGEKYKEERFKIKHFPHNF